MGKDSKETAEQKLLKLIETSGTPEGAATDKGQDVAKQTAEAVKGTGLPRFGIPSALKGLLGSKATGQGTPALGLRETNKILLLAILGGALFFAFDFLNGMKILQKNIDFSISSNVGDQAAVLMPQFKNLTAYLTPIDTRNIFLPFEKKAQE